MTVTTEISALEAELALAISRKYGFKPQSDDQQNSASLRQLRTLSRHVEQNRVQ